jgi:DNA-binding MarR family transcriptional regulator
VTARTASQQPPTVPRLSYLVFRLERRIRGRLDDALARHGVTTTEYMALSEMWLRSGLSSAQLARIAFVTPQAMNLVIRDLERRGLIRRRPGQNGGRVLHASLTRAGLSTLRHCDRALDDIELVMLATLDEEDRETLAEHLTACGQALHPEEDVSQATARVRRPPRPTRSTSRPRRIALDDG